MKRFKKLLLAGVLITGLVCYLRPMISKEDKVNLQIRNTEEQPIKISSELYSKNYILIRQKDSKVMLKEREEEAIAPASLTKLMTVYTALQHIDDLQKTVRIPASIFPQLEKEQASMAGFLPDEEVTYEDLIYGALLPSGADACMTLAISLYGSEDAFVAEMNAQAEKLKLKQTRFQNCTGLDEAGHVSSVRDIAWILDEALKLPKFAEAFHATNYVMAPSNMHPEGMTIYSTMRMTMDQNELSQDDILGGKTGYTKKAGLCLATQARIHEETWRQSQGRMHKPESGGGNKRQSPGTACLTTGRFISGKTRQTYSLRLCSRHCL